MAALRWLANELGRGKVTDVEIAASPPGLALKASVDAMSTPIRAGATLFVERIRVGPDEFVVELRLAQVTLALRDSSVRTPVATLIQSGVLDLSRPGDLAAYMPERPEALTKAKGDRVVLDLMKLPRFARHANLRRWLPLAAEIVEIKALEGNDDHLELSLRLMPRGLSGLREMLHR